MDPCGFERFAFWFRYKIFGCQNFGMPWGFAPGLFDKSTIEFSVHRECGLNGQFPSDHVSALTDVYTGSKPPEFANAADAKLKMREWVGPKPGFHPHVALHDFEAWLLPFWSSIQKLAWHNKRAPGGKPETINHENPPAHRIKEFFEIGTCRDSYIKPREAESLFNFV